MLFMSRKSRIDAPGAMHHIIVSGIDRQKIFKDDDDLNHLGGQRVGDNDDIDSPPTGSIGNSCW